MEQQSKTDVRLWAELPNLVEVTRPERSCSPPSLWRIGNKSLFETARRVRRRANKRLRTRRLPCYLWNSFGEDDQQNVKQEEEDTEEDCKRDVDGPPPLICLSESEEEEEQDDEVVDSDSEYDEDDLPDLISDSEDEEDCVDEGIADCDWFSDLSSMVALLQRFGLIENPQLGHN